MRILARTNAALAVMLLASCLGSRGSVAPATNIPASTATGSSDQLQGLWLLTLESRDLGRASAYLKFEAHTDGRFEAHSRAGVMEEGVGRLRALVARALGGGAYARGALLHITDGAIVRQGDTLRLSGQFHFPGVGTRFLTAAIVADHMRGELTQPSDTSQWATFEAARAEEWRPLRDYRAMAGEIHRVTAERIYEPSLLESAPWNAFFRQLDRVLPQARDDAEALFFFRLAARSIQLSHYSLAGEDFEELNGRQEDASVLAAAAPIGLTFPQPGVALLRIRDFSGTADPIDAAFRRIDSSAVNALILDLRGNRGGNLSSMSVAGHLMTEETPAGVFLGPGWWRTHAAPPTAEEQASFPVLRGYDVPEFFRVLHERGALAGRVEPLTPHFSGTVFVLTNRGTSSAAEPLVELLKASGRAMIFGERTAGKMLSAEPIRLQQKLFLIVPTADYYTARGARLEGNGVTPNVAVDAKSAYQAAVSRLRGRSPR